MSKALRAAIAALLALGLFGCDKTGNNAERFYCNAGNVFVVTDMRTDVQYLAWSNGYGGGVCVLVDANGKPLLAGDVND